MSRQLNARNFTFHITNNGKSFFRYHHNFYKPHFITAAITIRDTLETIEEAAPGAAVGDGVVAFDGNIVVVTLGTAVGNTVVIFPSPVEFATLVEFVSVVEFDDGAVEFPTDVEFASVAVEFPPVSGTDEFDVVVVLTTIEEFDTLLFSWAVAFTVALSKLPV